MELTLTTWAHVIGTVGAALLLFAYYLVSKGKVDGKSRFYQVLNILGAAGLAVNTGYFHAWPSMALNLVWIVIGVVMMRGIMAEKKRGDDAMKKGKA